MKVYIYYEENYHDVALDCGPVSDICIYSTEEKAINKFMANFEIGISEGFIADNTDDLLHAGIPINEAVKIQLDKTGIIALTMFAGYQDNFDQSYTMCLEVMEVM